MDLNLSTKEVQRELEYINNEQTQLEKLPIYIMIYKTETLNDEYTVYYLEIKTDLTSWKVQHRYREFRQLYSDIKKSSFASYLYRNKLQFPQKKVFKLRPEVIQQRQKDLSQFMNSICLYSVNDRLSILQNQQFCNFIQIKDLVKESLHSTIQQRTDDDDRLHFSEYQKRDDQSFKETQKLFLTPSFEKLIQNLLEMLNKDNKNKQKILKEFEDYFFQNKIKLQDESIIRLYLGDSYKNLGLLHYIGNIQQCEIKADSLKQSDFLLSQQCIKLLAKLLDHQKNFDADQYIRLFGQQEMTYIRSMKLDFHILFYSKQIKEQVFFIVNQYLSKNLHIKDLRMILPDERAIDMYTKRQKVKNNYKDMNLREPKNTLKSKFSFRNSSSFVSQTEDSQILANLNKSKCESKLDICKEVENEDEFFQQHLDKHCITINNQQAQKLELQQNILFKSIKNQFQQEEQSNLWVFQYLIHDQIEVFRNPNGYQKIEFKTDIEFDNFALEMTNFKFFKKIINSKNLFIKKYDKQLNIPIYTIYLKDKFLCKLYFQVTSNNGITVQISEMKNDYSITENFIYIKFTSLEHVKVTNHITSTSQTSQMTFSNNQCNMCQQQSNSKQYSNCCQDQSLKAKDFSQQNNQIVNLEEEEKGGRKISVTNQNLKEQSKRESSNDNNQKSLKEQSQESQNTQQKEQQSQYQNCVFVEMISSLQDQQDILIEIAKNLYRLKKINFYHTII